MLPNKPRGVPRVNDRRVLNGIFWVLRSGAPWRDVPDDFAPYTTCYNRFVRWRRAGVWARIMNALAAAHDASVQMIDTSIVRVHQHGACIIRNRKQSMGRSRGGLTSKIGSMLLADRGYDADWIRALPRGRARWPIFRRDAIAASRFALARISIEPAIWSNGSSIRSSTVGGLQRVTTSSRPTTSPLSSLHQYGFGCALMGPRPSDWCR